MDNVSNHTFAIASIPHSSTPVCFTGEHPNIGTRHHIALNVSIIGRSDVLYRILLGVRPQKQETDYAKFELDLPPLVCSLIAQSPSPAQGLRHLAFRSSNPTNW